MNRGEYMYVVVANFLGRHKILRLYLADANIILMQNSRARQYESKLSLHSLALFLYHEEYSLKSEKHVQTINTNLTA